MTRTEEADAPAAHPTIHRHKASITCGATREAARGALRPGDEPQTLPEYITLEKAAEAVSLSKISLKRAIKAGKLRGFKPGGKILIRPSDLRSWIEGRVAAVDPMPTPNRPAQPEGLMDQVLAQREELR